MFFRIKSEKTFCVNKKSVYEFFSTPDLISSLKCWSKKKQNPWIEILYKWNNILLNTFVICRRQKL